MATPKEKAEILTNAEFIATSYKQGNISCLYGVYDSVKIAIMPADEADRLYALKDSVQNACRNFDNPNNDKE